MPQRPQTGASTQPQHEKRLRIPGGMAQQASRNGIPRQADQKLITPPPRVDRPRDAEFDFGFIPPHGHRLMGGVPGFPVGEGIRCRHGMEMEMEMEDRNGFMDQRGQSVESRPHLTA